MGGIAIQREISQKEKNKYCILIYIYVESREIVQMNLLAKQRAHGMGIPKDEWGH